MKVHKIGIECLSPGRHQPRQHFDAQALNELAQSIAQSGLIQPVVVKPAEQSGQFEIIAGERRWRAAKLAGLVELDCLIKHDLSDADVAIYALVENLQRQDLSIIEEAKGLQKLNDDFGLTHGKIADYIGKSRTYVTNAIRLLKLEPSIQQYIQDGRLEAGHGKVLLALSPTRQQAMAKTAIFQSWSVRELEKKCADVGKQVDQANQMRRTSQSLGPDHTRIVVAISEFFSAPVDIRHNQDNGKGTLSFTYNSLEELEGILNKSGFSFEKDVPQGESGEV